MNTNEIVTTGILPDVTVERAVETLSKQGRWPTRGAWPKEEAECDAYVLRAFAGRPASDYEAYIT